MKVFFLILTFSFIVSIGKAQYFQFSQYNFTPERVNPALAASSNYARASFIFRNQRTGGGFNINSNMVNAAYPLINYRGIRWSGIGVSLLDDRTGISGLFKTQEASISYAVNIPLSKVDFISLGVKLLHARRKVDLGGLFTGSQYVEGHGFDSSLPQREQAGIFSSVFNTLSMGMHWQRNDKKGNRLFYGGFSFFDFNKPEDAFFEQSNPYLSTLTGYAGAQVYQKDQWSIIPEILVTRNAGIFHINAGAVYVYELKRYRNKPSDRIEFQTKGSLGGHGIAGLQFHKGNVGFGLSYDFPVWGNQVANTGAIEVAMEIRQLAKAGSSLRKNKRKGKNETVKKAIPAKTVQKQKTQLVKSDSSRVIISEDSRVEDHSSMRVRLKEKKDSVLAGGVAGQLQHEPLVIEETSLKFGFDFNSKSLNESVKIYLDELATAFQDNPELKVELTGHTDNIGSVKFNKKLSYDRAASLRDYLVEKGVDPERITIDGKGMDEPLNDNSTPEKRSENRRVEVKIFY